MKPLRPVFILGAGRSGTTLLYKLLALHQDVGYISNYDARFPKWVQTPLLSRIVSQSYRVKRWSWFSSTGNAYTPDRTWLRKMVPTPVEGEALFARIGLTMRESHSRDVITRLRKELGRFQAVQNSDVLVSKCTSNNVRVPTLAAAFPEARYIVLFRDGRAVAHSLTRVHWWNNHRVWWAGNRTPLEIERDGTDMLAIAARNWTEEVRALQRGIEMVPGENIRTIRFETLVSSPLQHLNELLEFAGLRWSERYDRTVRGLAISPMPATWTEWGARELDTVMKVELELLRQLNYV